MDEAEFMRMTKREGDVPPVDVADLMGVWKVTRQRFTSPARSVQRKNYENTVILSGGPVVHDRHSIAGFATDWCSSPRIALQIVTLNLVNASHKDITAFSLSVRANFPDGTAGIWSYGGDFFPYIAQMGTGALAPGAVFAVSVPVGQQPLQSASASVDLVIYADDTADVLNQSMFNTIVAQRKGRILGLQKANELLQTALADPNDAHPSITVAVKLKALAKQYENNPSAGEESLGLLDAATNISNAPKSLIGRSDKEDAFLRALAKTQQDRVSVMLPHTQLTKAVQP